MLEIKMNVSRWCIRMKNSHGKLYNSASTWNINLYLKFTSLIASSDSISIHISEMKRKYQFVYEDITKVKWKPIISDQRIVNM